MARKRYITSAMCGDDKVAEVAELDPLAALAWPWIITNLDDWGRMGANPREVRLNVFQAFPTLTAATIDQILTTLHGAGLAHLYEVDGRRFLQVNPAAYYKLQTYIDKNGPKVKDSSKLPPPLDHPWSDYWPESIWRVAESSGNRQSPQEVAETATSLQKPAETGGNCTLSFSSTLTSEEQAAARSRPTRTARSWWEALEEFAGRPISQRERDGFNEAQDAHGLDDTLIVAVLAEVKEKAKTRRFDRPLVIALRDLADLGIVGVRTVADWDEHKKAKSQATQRLTSGSAPPRASPTAERQAQGMATLARLRAEAIAEEEVGD